MDHIVIRELVVFARHGVLEEEKALGQKFLISMDLQLDTWKAAKQEDLSASMNYAEVCQKVKEFEQEHPVDLIETAAEELARYLLWEYMAVLQEITVTIEKPWAPIGLPLTAASVTITRGWHDVYIAMGSNMGDKEEHIRGAIRRLVEMPDIQVLEVSELIETEPYGYTNQDRFLNGCAHIRTICLPEEFLDILQGLELAAGRERLIHWGPRTLDLDILLYDQAIIGNERLSIPHPEMVKRSFVLDPLCEIAPWLLHPIEGKRIQELKRLLDETQKTGEE